MLIGSALFEYIRHKMNARAKGRAWDLEPVTVNLNWAEGYTRFTTQDYWYPVLMERALSTTDTEDVNAGALTIRCSSATLMLRGALNSQIGIPRGWGQVGVYSCAGFEFTGDIEVIADAYDFELPIPFIKAYFV